MAAALRTVAVTGARGMVARHVEAALTAEGMACLRVGRAQWDMNQWVDDAGLDRIFAGADAVVHAGAAVPSVERAWTLRETLDVNVRACLNLADWARRLEKHFVFISSASIYADPLKVNIVETDAVTTRPISGFYGVTKLMSEHLLDNLAGTGLKLCMIRPSSPYGTGMRPSQMVPTMLARACQGEDIPVTPPARDRVNLIHASDLAHAVVAALKVGATGLFNVAGPAALTIAEIAEGCVAAAGRGRVSLQTGDEQASTTRFQLDCRKALSAFGYRPQIALEEGLRRMLAQKC
jgi:UDP-glucose 4-epimerase